MLRAVEILAQMHDRARRNPNVPPPSLDRPILMQSERLTIELRKSTRGHIEKELGVAFSYPARGWHTYATKENGTRCLLSLFYREGSLVAAELYVPRSERAPTLEPRDFGGFRLEPGGVSIGTNASSMPQTFTEAVGGPARVVYDRAFEARFPGGVSYAMARRGTIERLTLYADLPKTAA